MTRRRLTLFVGLAAAAALAVSATAQANSVTTWNRIAGNTLVVFPMPAGGAAPALQINMAMVQGAVYDAANAIEPRHRPYVLDERFDSLASKDAAVATAAYLVLRNIVSTVPAGIAFPGRAGLLLSLDQQYTDALGAIPDGPLELEGIEAGTAAADAMLASRANDGRFASFWDSYVFRAGPGQWQPLLNPDGSKVLDPTPWVANVRPFLITSPSQFGTHGPNELTSKKYAEDVNETKALGAVNSSVRTPEQTHDAIFWQSAGGPALLWNPVARNLIESGEHPFDVPDSALLFAMLNLAPADASINCWNDKYHWNFWRPWTAIQQADRDGNKATEPDTTWAPLISAPYPEHPSGHLCIDGASLRVLNMFFGDKVSYSVTSSRFPEPRSFTGFREPLREIIEARVWAGLHFRTADVQAQKLGKKVVHYMQAHYFQPLR